MESLEQELRQGAKLLWYGGTKYTANGMGHADRKMLPYGKENFSINYK